jgi:uncharacterized protein with PIN domain
MDIVHYKKLWVNCPHCNHEFDDDDMNSATTDLWALAPTEERAVIQCPVCDLEFWVKGSYRPVYSSAFSEEELQ